MNSRSQPVIALLVVLFLSVLPNQGGGRVTSGKRTHLEIGEYDYLFPEWWDTIIVEVPFDLKTRKEIREHVRKKYGRDTGTKENWKEALKTWAMASHRLNDPMPAYIAHCHRAGEDNLRAARIYAELHGLCDKQEKSQRDWYRAYLSYCAGEAFEKAGRVQNAEKWYTVSSLLEGNPNGAVDYYAKKSAEGIRRLAKVKALPDGENKGAEQDEMRGPSKGE